MKSFSVLGKIEQGLKVKKKVKKIINKKLILMAKLFKLTLRLHFNKVLIKNLFRGNYHIHAMSVVLLAVGLEKNLALNHINVSAVMD